MKNTFCKKKNLHKKHHFHIFFSLIIYNKKTFFPIYLFIFYQMSKNHVLSLTLKEIASWFQKVDPTGSPFRVKNNRITFIYLFFLLMINKKELRL